MTRLLVAACLVFTVTAVLAQAPAQNGVVRLDPALDAVIPANAKAELLKGDYFGATEGPVWVDADGGYLLFSDMAANVIYKWTPKGQLSVFLEKSGYTGNDINNVGGQYTNGRLHLLNIGSNGLTLDRDGRVIIAGMTDRNITRLDSTGMRTVLADKYDGKRLNSPNDLVYRSDGSLYFTDPPFGLPKFFDDPRKETPYSGVYRWSQGTLQLLTTDLKGPNGLAFSPDERYLYVGNWDEKKKVVMRYALRSDGLLADAQVFADLTNAPGEDAIDGLKIDRSGNVYVSGPGGLWILSPTGRPLGTIVGPEHPHNLAWGDADGRTLYLTAQTGLYRMRVVIPGATTLAD